MTIRDGPEEELEMGAPARRNTGVAGVGVAMVLLAGCSSGVGEPNGTAATTSSASANPFGGAGGEAGELAELVEGVMADVGPRLAEARMFRADPIVDIDVPLGMYEDTRAALADATDQLPSEPTVTDPEVRDAYLALLDAFAAWDDDAASARAAMEEGREELGAAASAWAEGPQDGPPPQAYTDLIDVNYTAAATFAEACLDFATVVQVALHCGEEEGPPPPDDPGEVSFAIGTLDARIEPGPVTDELVGLDVVGFDMGQATLTLMVPPDVAAPGSARRDGAVEQPVPWPDDLVGWAEGIGARAEPLDDLDTPAATWQVTRLTRPDEPDVGVIANPFHPSGGHLLGESNSLVLYQTTIDGQPLVAVLEVLGPDQVDVFRQQSDDVIATLQPMDGDG
jgi:hypothetical protein